MKCWLLKEAKTNFGQLIKLAQTEGPQTVLENGKPVVFVVSNRDFKAGLRPKESVLEFFAPLRESGIRLRRRRDLPRKVRL
jgi:prevent-host-death family protein